MAAVALPSTHAREELNAADVVIETLEELPELLRTRFDAYSVLQQQH